MKAKTLMFGGVKGPVLQMRLGHFVPFQRLQSVASIKWSSCKGYLSPSPLVPLLHQLDGSCVAHWD